MDKFHYSNTVQESAWCNDMRTPCSQEHLKPAPVNENANYIKILRNTKMSQKNMAIRHV